MDRELTDDPFEAAFRWLVANEGGYVNDPLDRGGATKYGITLRSWADFTHRDDLTPEDIADISLEDARKFYHEVFWRPLGGDILARDRPAVAIALFDFGVLHGLPRAVRLAQLCLDGAAVDGIMGPKTRSKILMLSETEFMLRYVPAMALRLVSIAQADPSQVAFLHGWVARSMRLLRLIEA